MRSLLAELEIKDALSSANVLYLKNHILSKYPLLSSQKRATLLVVAINKIIDNKIPNFLDSHRKQLKVLLFRDVVSKSTFTINSYDILKASIKLKVIGNIFFKELILWLHNTLEQSIKRESLFNFVISTHNIMNNFPDKTFSEILKIVELNTGGIKLETDSYIRVSSHNNMPNEHPFPKPLISDILPPVRKFHFRTVKGSVYFKPNKKYFFPFTQMKNTLCHLKLNSTKDRVNILDCLIISSFLFVQTFIPYNIFSSIKVDVSATGYSKYSINETQSHIPSNLSFPPIERSVFKLTTDEFSSSPASSLLSPSSSLSTSSHASSSSTFVPFLCNSEPMAMKATAYDLSFESCGKRPNHPQYGITYTGKRATVGRTVAVDPKIIPLGSKIKMTFSDKFSYLNGIYFAEDTGTLVKGNIIDVFFGEDEIGNNEIKKQVNSFGTQNVKVQIIY